MDSRKKIFEYDNYRIFLKDSYTFMKTTDKKFSFRYFSRIAGFKSPNVLKKVMEGQSNLTEDSIAKFCQALKLNKEEALFFKSLVLLNQSKKTEEKQRYAEEIMRSRMYRKIHPLREAQYNYFAQWYYIPIRELVGLPNFKEDYKWMANSIVPNITPQEAQKAVNELFQIGLIERDGNGNLKQANAILSTPAEVTSTAVIKYHKEMIKKGSESIDFIARDLREISAVVFPVSKQSIVKIKEMVQNFRKEVVQVAAEDPSPDGIYQLNFQLFPLVLQKMGDE